MYCRKKNLKGEDTKHFVADSSDGLSVA